MGRIRRLVARSARRVPQSVRAGGWRIGLLRYEPERWTLEQWADAYTSGSLAYYGRLDELPRYSVVIGYVGWFAETIGHPPSILDIGCGIGLLRQRLTDDAFSEYVGVDLSDVAIAEARSRSHPRSRFLAGDVGAVELGRFDVVIVNEVLYYVEDPPAFLERMRSLCDPHGLLLVSMWRHPGDRSVWRMVDGAFPIFDRVEVRNRANPMNRRGWLVSASGADGVAHRPGSSPLP